MTQVDRADRRAGPDRVAAPAEVTPNRLAGQVALVTGAGAGIGHAIAARLWHDGAHVVATDINRSSLELVYAGLDCRISTRQLDVRAADQFRAVAEEVADRLGRLDILVNNAGVAGRAAPIWELTREEWREVIDVDLSGVFFGCQAAIPTMRAAGYGRIVNVASIAGKEGNPNAVPYSAAKAGVIGLTKAVAKEVVKDGILVNCVTPAVIETEILAQLSAEHVEYMVSRIPMGRMGQPAEVAALVSWLVSNECSFSTGAVFDISGGRATY
jgi:NAD(P)-dependent dehydrogenase (short-subunit alcohol dehydrogenase family)